MGIAYVVRFENCVAIDAPHSREFVERFKHEIPSSHRMWDGSMGCWVAWSPYVHAATSLTYEVLTPTRSARIEEIVDVKIRNVLVKPPLKAQVPGVTDDMPAWRGVWETWLTQRDEWVEKARAKKREEQMEAEKERLRMAEEKRQRFERDQQQKRANAGSSTGPKRPPGSHDDPFGFFSGFRFNFDESAGQHKRTYTSGTSSKTSTGGVSTGHHRTLFVCDDAPREVITAAYRALAKLHHTDTGGDGEAIKTINLAYESIRKGWS